MRKKFLRTIIVLALLIATMMTMSFSALAAGTETWDQQYGPWEKNESYQ